MTLIEFNEMEYYEKYCFLFTKRKRKIKINCFREDENHKYLLWDCGDFYVEMKSLKAKREIVSIEAIPLNDQRIDLYIDFVQQNKDKKF